MAAPDWARPGERCSWIFCLIMCDALGLEHLHPAALHERPLAALTSDNASFAVQWDDVVEAVRQAMYAMRVGPAWWAAHMDGARHWPAVLQEHLFELADDCFVGQHGAWPVSGASLGAVIAAYAVRAATEAAAARTEVYGPVHDEPEEVAAEPTGQSSFAARQAQLAALSPAVPPASVSASAAEAPAAVPSEPARFVTAHAFGDAWRSMREELASLYEGAAPTTGPLAVTSVGAGRAGVRQFQRQLTRQMEHARARDVHERMMRLPGGSEVRRA